MKFILLIALFTLPVLGQDMTFNKETGKVVPKYIGEIKLLKGRVYKTNKQGRTFEVKPGTRFFKDETIVTEEKSMARLLIVDDTILSVGPKTELNFEEFKFIDKNDRNIVYSLVKGQLTSNVKVKAKNEDDVVIKTKNATLGVRGTKILVNHQTLNKHLEVSQFALLSGSAQVTDNKNQNLKHELEKGEKVVIVHDSSTQERGDEEFSMSPEEFKFLLADEVNEETEFKPYMPFFEPSSLTPDSSLRMFFVKDTKSSSAVKDEERPQSARERASKGTFHNLEKLNEKLRENQKPR